MPKSLLSALAAALVFLASTPQLAGAVEDRRVAALASGGYIVVWGVPSAPPRIYGQIVDVAGQPLGPELVLAEGGGLGDVAADPSGGFLLAWHSAPHRLLVRRFDADGLPVGHTVLAADQAAGAEVEPLPDGGFALSWRPLSPESAPATVFRTFGPDGLPRGPEARLDGLLQASLNGLSH